MDYEKAYKEAFKRAERRFDPNPADGYAGYANGIIEDIFPQFIKREDERTRKEILDFIKSFWADHKESIPRISSWLAWFEKQKKCVTDSSKTSTDKDERIRKYLIEELKAAKSVGELKFVIPQPTREECIAYLEKQKESLTPEEKMKHPLYVEGFEAGKQVGAQYEAAFGKQKEQKPILEVFGFKVGDAVRLKDGDGRKHIIKSFKEVEGLHGPNFYQVEFEDNSARDSIYPGEEYPNGYYTQMEKIDDIQKPIKCIDFDNEFENQVSHLIASVLNREYEYNKDFVKYVAHSLLRYAEKEQKPSIFPPAWGEVRWNPISSVQKKPAEWSKDDDNFAYFVNQFLEYHEKTSPTAKSCKDWFNNRLKLLRPQPHWKPSEKEIIAFENMLKWEFADSIFPGTTLSGLLTKLKKLYYNESIPSWKPTKEQMEALEEMIILLRNLRRNTDDRKNLETLREQLGKL